MSGLVEVTVTNIRRTNGVAGSFVVSADVTYLYEDGSVELHAVRFHGSTYGGPVVLESGGLQVFVTEPSRFGDFSADPKTWVMSFHGV